MRYQRGISMIEVLITCLVLAVGLLGIAVFQSKSTVGSLESYQRAQAIILLEDMSARLQGNPKNAGNYLVNLAGTGDARPDDCSGVAAGAERDLCEWSAALKGASELANGNSKVGAMIGARGCVTQVQAENRVDGACVPAIYQISVVWQGMHETIAPADTCGKGLYGGEGNRRAIGAQVTIPLLDCQ